MRTIWILLLLAIGAAEPQFRLFDSVEIESNFDGEPPKNSFGVLLEGGYVLGSESSLFKQNGWARNNRIKILDSVGLPMIYFALIEPYAIDRIQRIVLYKIVSFTDPYGNAVEMNRFHYEVLKLRGASFIPKEGIAKRKKGYKNVAIGGGFVPNAQIPRIVKGVRAGVYYLANEEKMTKTMLFYPYTRAGAAKVTKSQLDVYLKEYDKVPPDLIFYTEQKNPSAPKIIDVNSELKAIAAQAKKEKAIAGLFAISNLSNIYPTNPVGSPVWSPNGELEGLVIASRPKDNLMLSRTRIFTFFCEIASRDGYEEALRKRILRACPASFRE